MLGFRRRTATASGGPRPRRVLPCLVAAAVATAALAGAFLSSGCGGEDPASTRTAPLKKSASDDRDTRRRDGEGGRDGRGSGGGTDDSGGSATPSEQQPREQRPAQPPEQQPTEQQPPEQPPPEPTDEAPTE